MSTNLLFWRIAASHSKNIGLLTTSNMQFKTIKTITNDSKANSDKNTHNNKKYGKAYFIIAEHLVSSKWEEDTLRIYTFGKPRLVTLNLTNELSSLEAISREPFSSRPITSWCWQLNGCSASSRRASYITAPDVPCSSEMQLWKNT